MANSKTLQQVRRYALEAPQGGGNNALLYGGAGAGALGLGAWYLNSGKKPESVAPASKEEEKTVPKKATEGSKVFKGGDQGFIGLVLDKVEEINHNTKRFRFKFDSEDEVSGLSIASAIITKYKGEKDEKPTIRPYTPVSDEGESSLSNHHTRVIILTTVPRPTRLPRLHNQTLPQRPHVRTRARHETRRPAANERSHPQIPLVRQ